jgi:hypothetical protein
MSPLKSASSGGPESADCFEIVTNLCDHLRIEWALAGALAVMRYRVDERPTNDIDLLVANSTLLRGPSIRGSGNSDKISGDSRSRRPRTTLHARSGVGTGIVTVEHGTSARTELP